MRNVNLFKNKIILFILLWAWSCFALEVPILKGRVNDYAHILPNYTINKLEQKLEELETQDSTQVVILTISSLEGEQIEDFAVRTFNKWGLGQKGKDNGVLLIVSFEERKIRIEVGRGLEGKLTDLTSSRIIRENITPSLATGDFDNAFSQGVDKIIKVIKDEYTGPSEKQLELSQILYKLAIGLAVLVFVIDNFLFQLKNQHKLLVATVSALTTMGISVYVLETASLVDIFSIGIVSFLVCCIIVYVASNFFDGIVSDFFGGDSERRFSGGGGKTGGGGASGKF